MKSSQYDGLNCLGAGLLTAIGAHGLLCLAALPGLFAASHEGGMSMLMKGALIIWTVLGIPAAVYVGLKTAGLFNGRNYASGRFGVIATMLLPLVGQPGAVTAFALIPAGAIALYLLQSRGWRYSFEFAPSEMEMQDSIEPMRVSESEQDPELEEAIR